MTTPSAPPRDSAEPHALPGQDVRGLRVAAYGALMGSADVIPGVSGGTVALILGIYERFVQALRDVSALRWRDADWRFLLTLGSGILAALAVGTVVLPPLLETYPVFTSALFFGLIAASLRVPWQRIGDRRAVHALVAAVATVGAFWLVGLPAVNAPDPTLLRVALSAAVAICAMVLPGVSGAFLLVVLGMYAPTLEAARNLDIGYLAAFAAGMAAGLSVFARALGWLLERYHDLTMAALLGLMLGSLRRLWPWGGAEGRLDPPTGDGVEVLVVVALVAAGALAVHVLLSVGARREHEPR